MKVVIQRVSRAEVRVDGEAVAAIDVGLLCLVGLERGDGRDEIDRAARKIASLRVFSDDAGRMNRDLGDVGGRVLAVSQFTLAGSIRRGRRPSFDRAMAGPEAEPRFDEFVERLRALGVEVATGVFGAMMEVDLVNNGPVTLIWDSSD
ncbi:MAG: D-aminoacyl-tRNA deacylase [Holophagae bacterium]|jgi:D-tyrosyl-tRNA(Tyr) deacylase